MTATEVTDRVDAYYRRIPWGELSRVRADWSDRAHTRGRAADCRCCGIPTLSADDDGLACHKVCYEIASYLQLQDRLPLLAEPRAVGGFHVLDDDEGED